MCPAPRDYRSAKR